MNPFLRLSMLFPDSVFSMAKPVRRMSVCPKIILRRLKNRLQQNGKLFGADCFVVFVCYRDITEYSCIF